MRSCVKTHGSETTQASLLLNAAYQHQNRPARPIDTEELFDDRAGCILTFSILLELGRGDLVHWFWRWERGDKQLPIDLVSLRAIFRDMQTPNWVQYAEAFNDVQWKYCAPKLDLNNGRQYPEQRIMPFRRKKQINKKGGTAQLWQIEVLEEFVEPKLREAVTKSRYDLGDGFGTVSTPMLCNSKIVLTYACFQRYEFALKTFNDGHRQVFENERDAFRALRNQTAMIQYLGEYVQQEKNQGNQQVHGTRNIILEYGESDLEAYFADHAPPFLQQDIVDFWRNLFSVADAVKRIHNLKLENEGIVREYYG
jgi:hypothetical protein